MSGTTKKREVTKGFERNRGRQQAFVLIISSLAFTALFYCH